MNLLLHVKNANAVTNPDLFKKSRDVITGIKCVQTHMGQTKE
jgi:hypothetical protein